MNMCMCTRFVERYEYLILFNLGNDLLKSFSGLCQSNHTSTVISNVNL